MLVQSDTGKVDQSACMNISYTGAEVLSLMSQHFKCTIDIAYVV